MNLGADSDQTQPVKASGDAKRLIGRVSPPQRCKNDETQAPIWPNPGGESFRRCKTQRDTSDRRLDFIVFALSRRRDTSDEVFCIAWNFHRLGLVRVGTWVHSLLLSSSFLNFLGCWNLTTALLNRVRWARFPCMKTESSRLDFFA